MNIEAVRIKCAELVGWKFHSMKLNPKDGGAVYEDFWTRPGVEVAELSTDAIAGSEGFVNPPNFPESADAALTLVEWQRKHGWDVLIQCRHVGSFSVSFIDTGMVKKRFDTHTASADTLPLAICLSFLKCHNINPEELK